MVFCNHKEKVGIAKAMGINIMIDDKIDTVLDCAENDMPICLSKRGHNKIRWDIINREYVDKDTNRLLSAKAKSFIYPVNGFREFTNMVKVRIQCEEEIASLV